MEEDVGNTDLNEIVLPASFSFYVFNYKVFGDYLFASEEITLAFGSGVCTVFF